MAAVRRPAPGWGAPRYPTQSGGAGWAVATVVLVGLLLVAPYAHAARGHLPFTLADLGALLHGVKLPTVELPGPPGRRSPHRPPAPTTARALLANPRLQLTANARHDLAAGVVDQRLVAVLGRLLVHHRLAVSVFKTGHSKYVAGTNRISRHFSGRAADIWQVDGHLVRSGDSSSRQVVAELAAMRPRPTEVGSPFAEYAPLPGFFTDAAHQDHIHVGVG